MALWDVQQRLPAGRIDERQAADVEAELTSVSVCRGGDGTLEVRGSADAELAADA